MSEKIKILAMPNSAVIAADSIKMLRSNGIVIVRCDEPEKVKLLADDPTVALLPSNEFMWSAVEAMARDYSYGEGADKVRKAFVQNLGARMGKGLELK